MASFPALRILCSVILRKGTGYPSAVNYANFIPAQQYIQNAGVALAVGWQINSPKSGGSGDLF